MRRYVFSFAMLVVASCMPVAASADEQQDKKIAEQVIQRLQAEKEAGRLKGFSIDLQVENGTLWVSGKVTSPEQQAAALDVARRVPGVKQVVNDLSVVAPATNTRLATNTKTATPTGSGVAQATQNAPQPLAQPVQATPVAPQPAYAAPLPANSAYAAPIPQQPGYAAPQHPAYAAQQHAYAAQQHAYAAQQRSASQRPVAFAPAHSVAQANVTFPGHHPHHAMQPGGPVAMGGMPGYCPPGAMGGMGAMGGPAGPVARYDSPQMPAYAWPSYAAYPNYGAVTYPKQYSASAWPYIGPFYPYPQVPLGWRKVCLEWDDGWWFLDFKDCR
jgi:hypothetical protein